MQAKLQVIKQLHISSLKRTSVSLTKKAKRQQQQVYLIFVIYSVRQTKQSVKFLCEFINNCLEFGMLGTLLHSLGLHEPGLFLQWRRPILLSDSTINIVLSIIIIMSLVLIAC